MSRTAKQIAADILSAHPGAIRLTPSSTLGDPNRTDQMLVTQPDRDGCAGDYEVVIYTLREPITLQKARGVQRAMKSA